MTVLEMYQEMQEQMLEDILNGYKEYDLYDDNYVSVEIDYTTQEWQFNKWHSISPLCLICCHTNRVKQIEVILKVYAVIAGADYEGQDFDTLRLFDCKSAAEDYELELQKQFGVDYTLIEVREVCMKSTISAW